MLEQSFPAYRAWAFLLIFLCTAGFQYLKPYQNTPKQQLQNWKINLPLGALNALLAMLICGDCLVTFSQKSQTTGLLASLPYTSQVILTIFCLDFLAYALHRFYHQVPVLWRLHSVHHTDKIYETSTALRFHPGEVLLSLSIKLGAVIAFGFPLLGLFLFEVIFLFFNLLEHSDFNLPTSLDRITAWVFITPSLHRLHHSIDPKELNSNYGTIFSFWDKILGSLTPSYPADRIAVGIENVSSLNFQKLLLFPLRRNPK